VISGDAVYRPGSDDEARQHVPAVLAAATLLHIDLTGFDVLAAAGHLAGLLRQSDLVESAGTGYLPELAPEFQP
jgi:hypothetical protein